jgi:lipoprotein-anchoring transpeptidase ErfK/SrfK
MSMLSPLRLVLLALAVAVGSVAFAATRPPPPRILASQIIPPVSPAQAAAPVSTPAATQQDAAYTIKSILPISGPLKMGDHHWDESAAPATGTIVITVDLAAQVLSVFRDGHEIGAAAVLFGADAKPTPLGVYPITQKSKDHVSNIYHAPMPYMLRMTNDGISIHASEVAEGYMTHGCIGVPKPFAQKLFDTVKLGDKVIVTRGEALEVGQAVKAA